MNDADILKRAAEVAAQAPATPGRAIPYAPVPMSWNVSQGQSSEGPIIVISVQTPEGDKVFFLQPSIGKQLGEALVRLSSASDSGLILPQ